MAMCRDCEAEIVWADNPNGRNIPLDANPIKDDDPRAIGAEWRFYTLVKGKAKNGTHEDRRLLRPLYSCHFDTCQDRNR